jgi:hypothetical protein
MYERNSNMMVVKVDMRKAHNEVTRAAVVEALEREPSLKHLAWHQATFQASQTNAWEAVGLGWKGPEPR